ncbi:phosphate ABC transporter substrate-binding protein, PhoT family [Desulfacinum hydrothermale DSM 13146]|uniref:Phosphate-binding protein n=1 Tax=Desulfacinum hydrothermale DSM 13146 TaxID=1121390 RepID=A0A1W1XEV9_9BACT|nr:phosphate ABC transporter substrate-binding protein [Desulfacinum hydrothermale]SMC22595.1 phosphate ABC transporter substrate-binding protein, PhoT family [Desulfacinum hydrothermale DSM 13146]
MAYRRGFLFICVLSCILAVTTGVHAGGYDAFKGLEGTLRISGGTAHIPVMKALAREVMTRYPAIRITIAGGGSGVGIKQVGEGLVDIGNSGRRPTDQEISAYGLRLHRWAVDGVAAVVHPENPVRSLTSRQVQDIFAGRVTNWKEVGGPDRAIHVFTRDEASGTRHVFWKKALGKGAIRKDADVVPSNGAMKTAVATDPAAIGYISVGYVDETVQALALDGVEPSLENVRSGRYPVARGLYSNTKGQPSALAQAFLDLLFAPEGRRIIASKGYIPADR